MKRFHKVFVILILLVGGCVALVEAQVEKRIYLLPDDATTPLVTVSDYSRDLTDESPVGEPLGSEGWSGATWSGPLKGYAIEGSSTKQLTLRAGTMVYQEPSFEGTVITMVDNNDERNENFRVVGVENGWEVVEFKKPLRIYVKTTNLLKSSEQDSSQDTQAGKVNEVVPMQSISPESTLNTQVKDIVDLESADNWVTVSSDDSTQLLAQQPQVEKGTNSAVADSGFEDDIKIVEAVELSPKPTDGFVIEPGKDSSEVTILEQQDEIEICPEPVVCKKVLPPIDQDPLVHRYVQPIASMNRQLTGKLVKNSLLCCMMKNSQFRLVDNCNRTLAYLDLCEVNNICHYLNRCVVVQGPIYCRQLSVPLTMRVKLIRIVR